MVWETSLICALLLSVLAEFAQGHCCIAKAMKCVKPFYAAPKHLVGKYGLNATPEALDRECRIHEEFYRCLDEVVYSCELSTEEGADEFEESRKLIWELCSKESAFRYSFLEHAKCINNQTARWCNFPVKLDATGKPDTCSWMIRRTLCIKHRVEEHCDESSAYLIGQVTESVFADYEECRIIKLAEENYESSEEELDRESTTSNAPEISERHEMVPEGVEKVLSSEEPEESFEESSLIEEVDHKSRKESSTFQSNNTRRKSSSFQSNNTRSESSLSQFNNTRKENLIFQSNNTRIESVSFTVE